MPTITTEQYIFDVDFVIAGRYDWNRKSKPFRLESNVGKLWDPSSKASKSFARQLYEHFQRKSQDFARLQTNSDNNSLPEKVKRHLKTNDKTSFEVEFKHFLESILTQRLKATQIKDGFIVVILQFKRELERNGNVVPGTTEKFFVISMLRDTSALKLDSDMRAEETLVINFRDLLQACKLDINIFSDNYVKQTPVTKSDVAFIAGSADVRDYFHEACGVNNVVKNRDSQSNLKQSLEDFMSTIGMRRAEKDSMRDSLHHFFKSNAKKAVTLETVQHEVDNKIPTRLANKKGTLISFINNSSNKVNSEIKINETLFEDLVWVKVDNGPVHMKVRRSDLGKVNSNKAVKFDKTSGKLTAEIVITDKETINRLAKAIQ